MFIFFGGLSTWAIGQQRPAGAPDIGAVTREAQTARPTPEPRREESGIVDADPVAGPGASADEETIFVKGFNLEHIPFINVAEAQKLLEPFNNRNLTYNQIEEAVKVVSNLYRASGYPVIVVYLPPQDLKAQDGFVILRSIVGSYGSVEVTNDSLVRSGFLKSMAKATFREGKPIRKKDLERLALLVNDLPGASLPRLQMGAGQTQGATDLNVQVPKGPRVDAFFSSDNMGSRYTGRWRFMAGIDLNSPFTIGDKLSVFTLTTGKRDLNSLALNYEFPLNNDGLRLNLGFTRVYYRLGKEMEDMDITGESEIYEGTLTYPIIRASNQNLNFSLNFAHKKMEDRYFGRWLVEASETNVGKMKMTYERWSTLLGKPFYARIGGGFTFGDFAIPDEEQRDSYGTDGAFGYWNLEFMANISFSPDWNFSLVATGQKSMDRKLDTSEQFYVTGSNGVKAYRESVSGDNGYLLNGELRFRLPSVGVANHWLAAFADYGYWSNEEKIKGLNNSDEVSDIGLSYTLALPHFTLRTQLVHGLGSYPEEILRKESETSVTFLLVTTLN
ncbi:MAG: hypothetical protein LBS60_14825 [Deltaproteobacteria bacterium]|nr:hypothetical protein [Deltaproteobacteria bacterium]